MGETTCLMQPFSYVSSLPNEANEGNPIHAFGQSISFGRFVPESLAWEKWSTFSHNRYVEEAERHSRPGSVAQKKAFFEAHYKQIAARKAAAALLEQENVASNDYPQREVEGDSQTRTLDSQVNVDKREEEVKIQNSAAGLVVENTEMKKSENEVVVENSVKFESLSQLGFVDDKMEASKLEVSEKTQKEKPLLQEPALSFLKSLHNGRASKLPPSPAKTTASTRSKKENHVIVTPISKTSTTDSLDYVQVSKLPISPAKFTAPTQPKKETNGTPIGNKTATCPANKKRSSPKSSHKSINFTPAREINRLASTIIRRFDSSGVGSSTKAAKDCSTPVKTPIMAYGPPKHPLATPWSENKSINRTTRTTLDPSTLASKTVRPKWHFFPTYFSKFFSPCRNKSQSPNLSTPFSFRTEERAARRKEKLEEKFNINQQQKVQYQATLKKKAETELRKLRQTLCFKARPLPDFYKERTAKNEMRQIPVTHPQSAKHSRKHAINTVQSTASQAQERPLKNISSKKFMEKNSPTPHYTLTQRTKLTHENMSPDILHE
ncbi:TPX2 domain-containing protein [Cephalotus follicularis]|uniref:TPX2 domain-containing protein n=1 Tax=Cephalotus follicularis TaxID=3775 RepID=A0A1Q3D736_CEPFO|nr:TPX2 domain-containing protein [Cephalotus follicularis]